MIETLDSKSVYCRLNALLSLEVKDQAVREALDILTKNIETCSGPTQLRICTSLGHV